MTKPVKRSELFRCIATIVGHVQGKAEDDHVCVPAETPGQDHAAPKTRILVAEDNPTNQKVALHILKKFGYRADAVGDGQEALNALEMVPYDLVLMDVQMPVLDGLAATRAIRNKQRRVLNSGIPIVARQPTP